jgi:hypothetical protein
MGLRFLHCDGRENYGWRLIGPRVVLHEEPEMAYIIVRLEKLKLLHLHTSMETPGQFGVFLSLSKDPS